MWELEIEVSSVSQFSRSVMSDSFRPHESQHARPPCPSPTPRSLPTLMSIGLVMPSNRLILCHPLLLLPSIFASIRVLTNETVVRISWPKYRSFSFSVSPSNGYPITQRQILYDSTYMRYLKDQIWEFSGSSVVRTLCFNCCGPGVQFLVKKLTSHKSWGEAKKKGQIHRIEEWNVGWRKRKMWKYYRHSFSQ